MRIYLHSVLMNCRRSPSSRLAMNHPHGTLCCLRMLNCTKEGSDILQDMLYDGCYNTSLPVISTTPPVVLSGAELTVQILIVARRYRLREMYVYPKPPPPPPIFFFFFFQYFMAFGSFVFTFQNTIIFIIPLILRIYCSISRASYFVQPDIQEPECCARQQTTFVSFVDVCASNSFSLSYRLRFSGGIFIMVPSSLHPTKKSLLEMVESIICATF